MPGAPERRDVGFLDAPDLDADELLTATLDALDRLAPGAVLTVYSVHAGAEAFAEVCGRGPLELIATIPHAHGGITFSLRQRPT